MICAQKPGLWCRRPQWCRARRGSSWTWLCESALDRPCPKFEALLSSPRVQLCEFSVKFWLIKPLLLIIQSQRQWWKCTTRCRCRPRIAAADRTCPHRSRRSAAVWTGSHWKNGFGFIIGLGDSLFRVHCRHFCTFCVSQIYESLVTNKAGKLFPNLKIENILILTNKIDE